jgi:antirestriction protein ArdC
MTERQRPEERITAAIVAQLEAGVRPWTQPWANGPAPAMPLRSTGEAYRGINTVMLWLRASNEGWTAPHWMTYRQASELGGQVRKGEASTLVVYYAPGPDHIRLPERSLFRDAEHGYSTAFHELIHWTGAKHRLDRTTGKRFGDADYAREELVAEMGAAFLGAHMGLRPDHIEDHSAYLDHWIKILKTDSRAILKAASAAQTAADFVMAAARKTMPADMAEAA